MYGHIEAMARAFKKGVDSVEGVTANLFRVPETLPAEGKLAAAFVGKLVCDVAPRTRPIKGHSSVQKPSKCVVTHVSLHVLRVHPCDCAVLAKMGAPAVSQLGTHREGQWP